MWVYVLYRRFQFFRCIRARKGAHVHHWKEPTNQTKLLGSSHQAKEVSDELLSSPVNKVSDRNCSSCTLLLLLMLLLPCVVLSLQAIHTFIMHMTFKLDILVRMLMSVCVCVTYDKVMTTFNFQKAKAAMRLKFIVHTRLLGCMQTNPYERHGNWAEELKRKYSLLCYVAMRMHVVQEAALSIQFQTQSASKWTRLHSL